MSSELKVRPFYRKWLRLRETIDYRDLDLFYKIINIEETCGRTMQIHKTGVFTNGRHYNPIFLQHWFPSCRCHINVLFPLWLLNEKKLTGKFAVIENDKHSAIINTETNEVYDPTYTANGAGDAMTLEKFQESYRIVTLPVQAANVDKGLFGRLVAFLTDDERAEASKALLEHAEVLRLKKAA